MLKLANNLMESAKAKEGSSEPLLEVTAHNRKENDPIMKYLDAGTGGVASKLSKGWWDLRRQFGVSGSDRRTELLKLSEGLTKKWGERQIVDEILQRIMLSTL